MSPSKLRSGRAAANSVAAGHATGAVTAGRVARAGSSDEDSVASGGKAAMRSAVRKLADAGVAAEDLVLALKKLNSRKKKSAAPPSKVEKDPAPAKSRPKAPAKAKGKSKATERAEARAVEARAREAAARAARRIRNASASRSRSPKRSVSPTTPRRAKPQEPCSRHELDGGTTHPGGSLPTTEAVPDAVSPGRDAAKQRGRIAKPKRKKVRLLITPTTAAGRVTKPPSKVRKSSASKKSLRPRSRRQKVSKAKSTALIPRLAGPAMDPYSEDEDGADLHIPQHGDEVVFLPAGADAAETAEAAGATSEDKEPEHGDDEPGAQDGGAGAAKDAQDAGVASDAAADPSVQRQVLEARMRAARNAEQMKSDYEALIDRLKEEANEREDHVRDQTMKQIQDLIDRQRAIDAENASNLSKLHKTHKKQVSRLKKLLKDESKRLSEARAEVVALTDARSKSAESKGPTVLAAEYERAVKSLVEAEAARTAAEAVATRIGDRRRLERAAHDEVKKMLSDKEVELERMRRRAVIAERKLANATRATRQAKADLDDMKRRVDGAEKKTTTAEKKAARLGKLVYGVPDGKVRSQKSKGGANPSATKKAGSAKRPAPAPTSYTVPADASSDDLPSPVHEIPRTPPPRAMDELPVEPLSAPRAPRDDDLLDIDESDDDSDDSFGVPRSGFQSTKTRPSAAALRKPAGPSVKAGGRTFVASKHAVRTDPMMSKGRRRR